eukprot:CAMPEP_0180801916 /NCGR_PEP_ID=MMETSP1038_2-20121128/59958_1 /TAXON_ID=632150 /ORGANISM="Azadinium spinosum, Strain 3D9" /LENGTH=52 /DNA_ID=CAMNT_0022841875 /DNA_START=52 /DNA_END=206 /DNA_ORIENTATION=-
MQELANTFWSFAALPFEDAPGMAAISSASLAKLQAGMEFTPQHLANMAWAIS